MTSQEEIKDVLDGFQSYSILNSTNDERLKLIKDQYISDLEIEYLSSGRDVLRQLSEPNSFAILDLNFYLEGLNKRLPIKRHPVFDEIDVPFGIIMPKGSDWAPILKDFFESGFVESNRYNQIISKHLGNSGLKLIRDSN